MDLSIIPSYKRAIAKLSTAWEEVLGSRSLRVVLIEGEAGARKTRLVNDFVKSNKIDSVIGHASQVPEPFLPLRQAYESMLRLEPVQQQLQNAHNASLEWQQILTSIARILPMVNVTSDNQERLAQWKPISLGQFDVQDGIEMSESMMPITLPRLFGLALGELTGQIPVALFMDDVSLMDKATLDALTLDILPSLTNRPVLFIATFEPASLSSQDGIAKLVDFAEDDEKYCHVKLSQLDESDIRRVLESQAIETMQTQWGNLAPNILEVTEGNLARVQDIILWMGDVEPDVLQNPSAIPCHIDLIRTQFNNLSSFERQALQLAATQGVDFCLEAVAKAMEQEEEKIEAVFQRFEKQGAGQLIPFVGFSTTITVNGGVLHWYRFRVRPAYELIYGSIADFEHLVFHRKVAEVLEVIYGQESHVIAGLLAQQFKKGDIRRKYINYLIQVARQSNDRYASDQILQDIEGGLVTLQTLPNSQQKRALKSRLLLEKGRALRASKRKSHLAVDVLRESIRIAREMGSMELYVNSARYLGEALLDARAWDEGVELLTEAITEAARRRDWAVVFGAMEALRGRYDSRGEFKTFFELCDDLADLISQDTSPDAQIAVAEILEDEGWLYYRQGKYKTALEKLDQALGCLEGLPNPIAYPEIHYKIHRWKAEIVPALGELAFSLEEANEAIKWAEFTHQREHCSRAHVARAMSLQRSMKIDESREEYEFAIGLMDKSSDLSTLAELENNYAIFLHDIGSLRDAKAMYDRSYAHNVAVNNHDAAQMTLNNRASVEKYLGEFESALTTYRRLLSEGRSQEDKVLQILSLNHIGDINRIQNRVSDAELSHSQAFDLCEEVEHILLKAISLHYLGRVHLTNWNITKASQRLETSGSLFEEYIGLNAYHYVQISLARLHIYQQNYAIALKKLESVMRNLRKLRDWPWLLICYLNQGLAYLMTQEFEKALSSAKVALEISEKTDFWYDAEIWHLLARCNLALGNFGVAQSEIEQAKTCFRNLGLSYRVYQAESTELRIQEAQQLGDLTRWRKLSPEELQYDFNHLGV